MLLAVFSNGSFSVPRYVAPERQPTTIFMLFFSIGILLASSVTPAFYHVVGGEQTTICSFGDGWYGLVSGFMIYLSCSCVFAAFDIMGIAAASTAVVGSIIFLGFLEGLLLRPAVREHVTSIPLTVVGLALVLVGLGIVFYSKSRPVEPSDTCGSTLDVSLLEAEADTADDGEKAPGSLPVGKVMLGLVITLGVGVGAVGNSFIEDEWALDCVGLPYVWYFGWGNLLSALVFTLPVFYLSERRLPRLHDCKSKSTMLLSTVSGGIWGITNICNNLAGDSGIEPSTIMGIWQCSLFVASIWGVFLFKELTQRTPIIILFTGCTVMIGGVITFSQGFK